MLFKAFEWDRGNIEHVFRHGVGYDEVEEACVNNPYVRKTADERYLVYGITDSGRYLLVVGINKGKGVFRTITARDMTEREKSLYKRRLEK
ncbi:MAG: BrnT family toxin [Nitrospirae bacterium]|nr:BrnT family toxin [Nitrospirota bacterium]